MNEKKNSYDEDQRSRKRIVSKIKQNFFVEASAGSGKTTMLVERMVAMVEGGLDISKICTITFTKAAAGEFYDRFQELLDRRSKAASEESNGESTVLPPRRTRPENGAATPFRISISVLWERSTLSAK